MRASEHKKKNISSKIENIFWYIYSSFCKNNIAWTIKPCLMHNIIYCCCVTSLMFDGIWLYQSWECKRALLYCLMVAIVLSSRSSLLILSIWPTVRDFTDDQSLFRWKIMVYNTILEKLLSGDVLDLFLYLSMFSPYRSIPSTMWRYTVLFSTLTHQKQQLRAPKFQQEQLFPKLGSLIILTSKIFCFCQNVRHTYHPRMHCE